jgi:hypothetical protein
MKKILLGKFLFTVMSLMALNTAILAQGEYCNPTFANGCSLWNTASVTLDSIVWSNAGTICTTSDYTAWSTTLNAGESRSMNVTSGSWCGCAVWIDFNQDFDFSDSENLHFEYVGGDPSYAYDFDITVPSSTPAGTYRLRVISPWGSDGFSPAGTNGYGACGDFQYGNFQDFTIHVANNSAVSDPMFGYQDFTLFPNPAADSITIDAAACGAGSELIITDMMGNLIERRLASSKLQMDISALCAGVYSVTIISSNQSATQTLVKL